MRHEEGYAGWVTSSPGMDQALEVWANGHVKLYIDMAYMGGPLVWAIYGHMGHRVSRRGGVFAVENPTKILRRPRHQKK